MENCEVWASPRHFWKRLGQEEEAQLLTLEFQVCGLSSISEESSEEREDVEEVKRKPVGETQTETRVWERKSPTGVRAVGTKAAWLGRCSGFLP